MNFAVVFRSREFFLLHINHGFLIPGRKVHDLLRLIKVHYLNHRNHPGLTCYRNVFSYILFFSHFDFPLPFGPLAFGFFSTSSYNLIIPRIGLPCQAFFELFSIYFHRFAAFFNYFDSQTQNSEGKSKIPKVEIPKCSNIAIFDVPRIDRRPLPDTLAYPGTRPHQRVANRPEFPLSPSKSTLYGDLEGGGCGSVCLPWISMYLYRVSVNNKALRSKNNKQTNKLPKTPGGDP